MDVLTEVLTTTGSGKATFRKVYATAPWGLSFEQRAKASFHVVAKGNALLMSDPADATPVNMESGDVVLLPHGAPHILASDQQAEVVPLSRALESVSEPGGPLHMGGGGAAAELLCGGYGFGDAQRAPVLLRLLPSIIYVPATRLNDTPLRETIDLITRELREAHAGQDAAIARLIDLMFVYIVRSWPDLVPEEQAGWLAALRDREIGRALELIHGDLGRRWTVDELAAEVALSRSSFARKFAALVGQPPLSYLTQWRMELATRLLHETDMTLAEIASRVGYASEFAFNKAFKREVGTAPGTYRQQQRSVESAESLQA